MFSRSFVDGGNVDFLAGLCDMDTACVAYAFSAVESSVRDALI